MTLQEKIIEFCVDNMKSIGILAFVGGIFSLVGFKKEWGGIFWVIAVITLPALLVFVIWVIMFVSPYIRDSIISILFN
ncbi:hypothetical protein KAT36_01095 [Candidatus Pacearchaeota archaeon]|nr:hypothetical protein [Candidatus Pacearchaeota archaeon]